MWACIKECWNGLPTPPPLYNHTRFWDTNAYFVRGPDSNPSNTCWEYEYDYTHTGGEKVAFNFFERWLHVKRKGAKKASSSHTAAESRSNASLTHLSGQPTNQLTSTVPNRNNYWRKQHITSNHKYHNWHSIYVLCLFLTRLLNLYEVHANDFTIQLLWNTD